MNRLLHTPEGVRDLYGNDGRQKELLTDVILGVMNSYGYRNICTPSFEFFDIFNKERGTVASKEMFKFFDQEGNTLVLRPDMTPSIARSVAKYYKDSIYPVRLCYNGNTYINNHNYQGRLKETTQLGVELFNDASVSADAEMIALTVEALKKAGLSDFQIEIGNAGFFKGLIEQNNIDADLEEELRVAIKTKNIFKAQDLLSELSISEEQKKLFLMLPETFGSIDKISPIKAATDNTRAQMAIERLEALDALLKEYDCEKYISYDLGMLSKYNYYTGIIFRAITYGTGEAIASGGRYNNLVSQFGLDVPAIGMSITLDYLMIALDRQGLLPKTVKEVYMVAFSEGSESDAISYAKKLRHQGKAVSLSCVSDMEQVKENLISVSEEVVEVHCIGDDTEVKIYRL